MQKLLIGGARSNRFMSSWSKLSNEFRDAIEAMKPEFEFRHPSDMAPSCINLVESDDDVDEEENDDDGTPPPPSQPTLTPNPRKRPNPNGSLGSPQVQRPKTKSDGNFDRQASTPRPQQSAINSAKQEPNGSPSSLLPMQPPKRQSSGSIFQQYQTWGKTRLEIAGLSKYVKEHKKNSVPDHIDTPAYEELVLLAVNPWNLVLKTLSDELFRMLRECLLSTWDNVLSDYKQTRLYREARTHIIRFLDSHEAEQRRALDIYYDLESSALFTINNKAFSVYKNEEFKQLNNHRRRISCSLPRPEEEYSQTSQRCCPEKRGGQRTPV